MKPLVLELTASGLPNRWVTARHAAEQTFNEKVLWGTGDIITLKGGWRGSGERSVLDVFSIIAVNDGAKRMERGLTPSLNNKALFRRDRDMCLYCGESYRHKSGLTRDHVIPTSKGGPNIWTNVVSACFKCNNVKGDRTPEEAGMNLLAVPYTPNIAEWLILANRRILQEQMDFLKVLVADSRLESLEETIRDHQSKAGQNYLYKEFVKGD